MREWRQDKSLETLARFDPNVKPEHCKLCGHIGKYLCNFLLLTVQTALCKLINHKIVQVVSHMRI